MGIKLFNLQKELSNMSISDEHKETIKSLISFYEERKRLTISRIIEDMQNVANISSMFVSIEKSEGYNDETVKRAEKEYEVLYKAIELLAGIDK